MRDWHPSSGIDYTEELREVITSVNSVAVLAGAGSGKTELLAQKADYLFHTGLCPWPKRILCLTFKREAQYNIGQRVQNRCGKRVLRFDSYTFHAFAKSILDRFYPLLPKEERPDEGYNIVDKASQANGKNKLTMDQVVDLALSIVSNNISIRDALVNSYSHVFVDEFQDTTHTQYSLIKSIFSNSETKLLCVGDVNQSIMIWAGANKTVFSDYLKDFGADRKLLVTNYRSSAEIHSILSIFLEFLEGKQQISVSQSKPTNCSINVYKDEVQEAAHITNKISQLIDSGIERNQICILTKQLSSTYTKAIRDTLSKQGIYNLDMSDLQDSLKEPVGELFALYIKFLIEPEPSVTVRLCELYLLLNNVVQDDEREEYTSKKIFNYIYLRGQSLPQDISVDFLLKEIQDFFDFIGLGNIKGRWKQYQSQDFFVKLWNILEVHLRNVFANSKDSIEAVRLFTADNAVQVMNVHKCKGLEYKAVFFVGLEDQAFWNYGKERFENDCAIYVVLSRAMNIIDISYVIRREHRYNGYYDNRNSTCSSLRDVYTTLIDKCLIPVNYFNNV